MAWACCGTAVGGGWVAPEGTARADGFDLQTSDSTRVSGRLEWVDRLPEASRVQNSAATSAPISPGCGTALGGAFQGPEQLPGSADQRDEFLFAELGLAQAQANEFIALDQIYQAMGGGWQQQDHGCIELAT